MDIYIYTHMNIYSIKLHLKKFIYTKTVFLINHKKIILIKIIYQSVKHHPYFYNFYNNNNFYFTITSLIE